MNRIRNLGAALALLLSAAAQGQWQWIDKDGRKVFSDRGPPPDIPAKNIIKQPGNVALAPSAVASAAPARSASAAAEALPEGEVPKLGAMDKELADKKKQADAAAAAKVRAEEERVAKIKADNCERSRSGKALMDSGVRVSITNAKGEREILDDAGRAAELKRIQAAMEANCK
jgi:hypothetical protein